MNDQNLSLPSILITGASGIVGRQFIKDAKKDFRIYAIARRSQKEAEIPQNSNIIWLQEDICNSSSMESLILSAIKKTNHPKKIDFVLHLASYYDFNCRQNPEYQRTNVQGTKNVLELSKKINIRRFIFMSSLVACCFPQKGEKITEKNIPDGKHPYAISKKKGEELVKDYSNYFPCSIIRSAAVFTDWCEYGILYMLLSQWFSGNLCYRVIAGKGESAIPYIHSYDLNQFLFALINKSNRLPNFDIYIASSDYPTSQKDIFIRGAYFYYRKKVNPIYLPKILTLPVIIFRSVKGCLIKKNSLAKPWMLKYIDKKLEIDNTYSKRTLAWKPNPRFHILRRLLYMVEKNKTHPVEWHRKNIRILNRYPRRPNLLIYETMIKLENQKN